MLFTWDDAVRALLMIGVNGNNGKQRLLLSWQFTVSSLMLKLSFLTFRLGSSVLLPLSWPVQQFQDK